MVRSRTNRCVEHVAEHLRYPHLHRHRRRHHRRHHRPLSVLRRCSRANRKKKTEVMSTGATAVTYCSSNDASKYGSHQAQETARVCIKYTGEMQFMLTFTSIASHELNGEHHHDDSTGFELCSPTDFSRLRSTVSALSGCQILTSCSSPLVAMMGKCG